MKTTHKIKLLLLGSSFLCQAMEIGKHVNPPPALSHSQNMNRDLRCSRLVSLLIEHGAQVNYLNDCGQTVLDQAVMSGNLDLVKVLTYHGANDKAVTRNQTSLDYAFSLHCLTNTLCLEIIEWLINHGVHSTGARPKSIPSMVVTKFSDYPLLQAVIDHKPHEIDILINSYVGNETLDTRMSDDLNRAFTLAAAVNLLLVTRRLQHSPHIRPETLTDALISTASNGPLASFKAVYDLVKSQAPPDQFANSLAQALYWAVINKQLPITHFILEQALVLKHAPQLPLQESGTYITTTLKRDKNLPTSEKNILIDVGASFKTAVRIRQAGGKNRLTEDYSFINTVQTAVLPQELLVLIACFALGLFSSKLAQ